MVMVMRSPEFDVDRSFLIGSGSLDWTDYQRRKYLRRLIEGLGDRLESLRRDPELNARKIFKAEILLASFSQELAKLEAGMLLP
jgi:hypothetical protein